MAWSMGLLGAAGGNVAGAYDLLRTTVLTSPAAAINFGGLGNYSNYKHLQLRTVLAEDNGTTNMRPFNMTLNGDIVSSYSTHNLRSNYLSNEVLSGSDLNNGAFRFDNMVGPDTATNSFAGCIIDILDFASTSKNKTFRLFGGGFGPEGGEYSISLRSGLYESTSAITSIYIYANSNNFLPGSRISLYGIKG